MKLNFLQLIAAAGVVFAAIGIILFILSSIGLKGMADKRKVDNSWLVWLPFANLYILGKTIGDETELFGYKIKNLGLVLLGVSVATMLSADIEVLGKLIGLACLILSYKSYFDLFKLFKPGSEVLYIVLSFIPVFLPIILFTLRNNKPIFTQNNILD